MAFRPPRKQPTFNDLVTVLDGAKLSQKQPALYQTIYQIITRLRQFQGITVDDFEQIQNDINQINSSIANITVIINNLPTPTAVAYSFIPMATGAEPLDFMSNGAGEPLLIGFSTTQPI